MLLLFASATCCFVTQHSVFYYLLAKYHRLVYVSVSHFFTSTTHPTQVVRRKLRCRLAEERWYWSRSRERAGEERQTVSRLDTYAAAKEQAREKRRCDGACTVKWRVLGGAV